MSSNVVVMNLPQVPAIGPIQEIGRVIVVPADGPVAVRVGDAVRHARRAASCLLRPEVGDEVLLLGPSTEQLYVVAVTVRAEEGPSVLQVEGDLQLRAGGSIEVSAGHQLDLEAARLGLRAEDGEVSVARLQFNGLAWRGVVGTVHRVSQLCETVVDRALHFAKTSIRRVEGMDQLRSGQIDHQAKDYARLRSRHVAIKADSVAKLKAEQMHLN